MAAPENTTGSTSSKKAPASASTELRLTKLSSDAASSSSSVFLETICFETPDGSSPLYAGQKLLLEVSSRVISWQSTVLSNINCVVTSGLLNARGALQESFFFCSFLNSLLLLILDLIEDSYFSSESLNSCCIIFLSFGFFSLCFLVFLALILVLGDSYSAPAMAPASSSPRRVEIRFSKLSPDAEVGHDTFYSGFTSTVSYRSTGNTTPLAGDKLMVEKSDGLHHWECNVLCSFGNIVTVTVLGEFEEKSLYAALYLK